MRDPARLRPFASPATFAPLALGFVAAACVPHRDYSPAQIERLTKLDDVMDVQATIADPQFKKAGQPSYSDADWAGFADMGGRLQVTSLKIHQFSKGPEFDALANRLHAGAEALSAAANSKNAASASSTLGEIKLTCKTCHAKFK